MERERDSHLFDCLNVALKMHSAGAVRRLLCRFVRTNPAMWHAEHAHGTTLPEFHAYVRAVEEGRRRPGWWFLFAAVLRFDLCIVVKLGIQRIVITARRSSDANAHKKRLYLTYDELNERFTLGHPRRWK